MKALFRFVLNRLPRPWLIRASYWVRPIMALFYRGDRYTDPIDGRSFRTFLPYGYGKTRENVLSPSTLSLERHRLLWLFLNERTDFFDARLKVLHFAPEQAFYRRFRAMANLEYTTTDLDSPLADVKADICDLPFDDGSFDVVLCNHVLEHIPDDAVAMAELYRIMRPGGWGVFQVPQEIARETTFEDDSITDPRERAEIFGQYDHVRVYGADYFERLRAVGFEVEAVDLTAALGPEAVERYRLAPGELVPYVRRSAGGEA